MGIRIGEMQPVAADLRILPELSRRESQGITAVTKSEGSLPRRLGSERESTGNQATTTEASAEQVGELVEEVQSYLRDLDIHLSFNIEDKTGDLVVRVMDRETGEVIRQIPTEDLMKLREKLQELRGVLFDDKV